MQKLMKWMMSLLVLPALFAVAVPAAAQEAPDVMIRRIVNEVQAIARQDKDIQAGNKARMMQVVQDKVLPYVDFERMTSLAAGRFWRQATDAQKNDLMTAFKDLLVFTYAGALSQANDKKVEFRALKLDANATDAEVRSRVLQPQGEPILLNYRVIKEANAWKIYDVNVMGAWLIETYKSSFADEISKGGMDGLIKSLQAKNKQLAAQK